MSYDLTIKADDDYSQSTEVRRLIEFVVQLPHVRPNGARGFVLDDHPLRWMEIDLEVVTPDGEYDEERSESAAEVNCVRLHIPYAYLGGAPERDYFPVALAVARFLGWRLYDEQTGEDVSDVPQLEPGRGALGQNEASSGGRRPGKSSKGKRPSAGKRRKSSGGGA